MDVITLITLKTEKSRFKTAKRLLNNEKWIKSQSVIKVVVACKSVTNNAATFDQKRSMHH